MVPLLDPHHVGTISASGNCCSPSISHRVSTGQRRACEQSVFVVRVVASLARVPPPPQCCFPFAVASKCFGLISFFFKKKEEERSSSGNETLCLCGAFAQFNIKERQQRWGVTESVCLVEQIKVNFQGDICLEGRLLASSSTGSDCLRCIWPRGLQMVNDVSCLISCVNAALLRLWFPVVN